MTSRQAITHWLKDVESRGQLSFNKRIFITHEDAEAYARKKYPSVLERDVFVAGWHLARRLARAA